MKSPLLAGVAGVATAPFLARIAGVKLQEWNYNQHGDESFCFTAGANIVDNAMFPQVPVALVAGGSLSDFALCC